MDKLVDQNTHVQVLHISHKGTIHFCFGIPWNYHKLNQEHKVLCGIPCQVHIHDQIYILFCKYPDSNLGKANILKILDIHLMEYNIHSDSLETFHIHFCLYIYQSIILQNTLYCQDSLYLFYR